MINSSVAGRTSNSFVSLDYFREYESTRVNAVLTDETDETVEKYLITASTLVNSNDFKGMLFPISVLYTGNINVTGSTLLFPSETEETFTELFSEKGLVGDPFCINTTNDYVTSGEIVGIDTVAQIIYFNSNEELQDYSLTDAIFITSGEVEGCITSYRQQLKMPRYSLVEGGQVIPELYLPVTFKNAICEVAILLKVRGSTVQIPEMQHGGISSAVLDVLEVEYFQNEEFNSESYFTPLIKSLLAPFVTGLGSNSVINTRRSF